jgi:hypothetical protein
VPQVNILFHASLMPLSSFNRLLGLGTRPSKVITTH